MHFILCCPSHYVFQKSARPTEKICNEEMVVFGVLGQFSLRRTNTSIFYVAKW